MRSASVFFDTLEDGGTVFPLLNLTSGDKIEGTSDLTLSFTELAYWQSSLGKLHVDPNGYGLRRVDAGSSHPFQVRAWETAQAMCNGGAAKQRPVTPRQGSVYIWNNHLSNGVDDLRAIHAGCGSKKHMKVMGTFFIREGPGPFPENKDWWDPAGPELPFITDELKRQTDALVVQNFRLKHLNYLYEDLLDIAFELGGWDGWAWEYKQQLAHFDSLDEQKLRTEFRLKAYELIAGWNKMGFK